MCGYIGSELVELTQEIAARELALRELVLKHLRYELEHDLPGVVSAAHQVLCRNHDREGIRVLANARAVAHRWLEEETRTGRREPQAVADGTERPPLGLG